MKDKKIIDNTYIKVKTLGSGGEGVTYLVLEKGTNLQYAAKTLYDEDKHLEETKRIFNKIKQINCPYIIRCIKEGNGKITKDNEVLEKRQYFILEYAPKGDLWKIIYATQGFGERCSKLIFKKILLGVQALHQSGIYHQDLKIDNIVLDNNFNPKIFDYGFATDQQGKLKNSNGTKEYIRLLKNF